MKNTKYLAALVLLSITLISCNNKKKENDDDIVSKPNKDTLSSWASEGNGLWSLRLDLVGANLSGTPFTMIIKLADSGEVTCANTILAGSEGNGSYRTGVCSVTHTSPQATSVGNAPFESTAVGGTYTNDGTTFTLCKSNGSCQKHN